MVENLVREGVEILDFGMGDADYKRRFADQHYLECSVFMFGRSFRGLAAASVMTFVDPLGAASKRLATQLGLANALKMRWRRRLRPDTERPLPSAGDEAMERHPVAN